MSKHFACLNDTVSAFGLPSIHSIYAAQNLLNDCVWQTHTQINTHSDASQIAQIGKMLATPQHNVTKRHVLHIHYMRGALCDTIVARCFQCARYISLLPFPIYTQSARCAAQCQIVHLNAIANKHTGRGTEKTQHVL